MFFFGFGFSAEFIMWILVGGVVGYLSAELGSKGTRVGAAGCATSTVVGAIGGFLAGFLFGFLPGMNFGLGQFGKMIIAPAVGAFVAIFLLGFNGRASSGTKY